MLPIKSIIAVLLSASALSLAAAERYYTAPHPLKPGTIICDSITLHAAAWSYHCRVRLDKSVRNPKWSFVLDGCDGYRRKITILRPGKVIDDANYVQPIELTLADDRGNILHRYIVDKNIDGTADAISLILEKFAGSDSVSCRVGQRYPLIDFVAASADSVGYISLEAESPVGLLRLSLMCQESDNSGAETGFGSLASLNEYLLSSENTLERVWRYLDRDTDSRLLNLGGDYSLATVRKADGSYDILYIGGARVNRKYWKPLMLKGRLMPTPFINHYDLMWYDAYGRLIDREVSADIENGGSILKLNLPLQGGTVRFAIVSTNRQ